MTNEEQNNLEDISQFSKRIISVVFGCFIGLALVAIPTFIFYPKFFPWTGGSHHELLLEMPYPRLRIMISIVIWGFVGLFNPWIKIMKALKPYLFSFPQINSVIFYLSIVGFLFVYRYIILFIAELYVSVFAA
jgi:hypothetical protein